MHRPSRSNTTRYTKAIFSAAKTAYRQIDSAGSSLGRWITKDHTGFSRSILGMPKMSFLDTCRYVLTNLVIALIGALVSGLLVFLLIAYGIPYFLFGSVS